MKTYVFPIQQCFEFVYVLIRIPIQFFFPIRIWIQVKKKHFLEANKKTFVGNFGYNQKRR